MLLLFPKPADEEVTAYSPLAVNLHTYDEISIVKNEDTDLFTLQLAKICNPHTNQPAYFCPIGVFRTSAGCLTLFQAIVEAVESGSRTFELPMPELPVSYQEDQEYARPNNPARGYN